ncbi:MAG: hypothetical protein IJT66_03010 [Clostridia bacterium]|nr:hypothetical protein [Clostridia bacterium]
MKKISVSLSFDEEKFVALKLYLKQKENSVEDELTKSLETLYLKNVPAGVRDFLTLRSGNTAPSDFKTQKGENRP